MRNQVNATRAVSLVWTAALIGSLLAMSGLTSQAYAATYYVTTTGFDTNPGTQAGPFRTIQNGIINTGNAGDTIEVAARTYREKPVFDSSDSGTPAAPVILHGASGAIIDASNASSGNLT